MANIERILPSAPSHDHASDAEKKVIGIYGISGCGKTFLLNKLEDKLQGQGFAFYDGSDLINSTCPGGLQAFKELNEQEKLVWREAAINRVAKPATAKEHDVVIAGHYMFWNEQNEDGMPVFTPADWSSYTHIIYLDVPAETVADRRQHDFSRDRPKQSVWHLERWSNREKNELRRLCYEHNILFTIIKDGSQLVDRVSLLLQDFRHHTQESNTSTAIDKFDDFFGQAKHQWEQIVVLDADKTLTAIDTGNVFWKHASKVCSLEVYKDPLKEIFSSKMKYSHTAFRQAMLLYEETMDAEKFQEICDVVASNVTMYPEFICLLQAIDDHDKTSAIVVTCGLKRIWEKVLEKEGLSDKIKVMGGGRLDNKYVVTGETKTELVRHAKRFHNVRVCAIGDSPLDLGMLKEAHQAVVLVGDEDARSKSMEIALQHEVENHGFRAYQVVLPSTAPPRLDINRLPQIQLTEPKFVREVLSLNPSTTLNLKHASGKDSAKLLMTPMRDASNSGPVLRAAHRHVGHYLATHFLSKICGVEQYPVLHVQGHNIAGFRVRHEAKTLIVPLMRGGEAMAFGVNDVLPSAMFLHANEPGDICQDHLHGRLSVILVDSVVNSGKSILEFVNHIRAMHATIRIVVMAGVVQSDAVARLSEESCCGLNVKLIALRLSENKFTGKGTTDTGNRLFNTVHLE